MHIQVSTTDPERVRTEMLKLDPSGVWVDLDMYGGALVTMKIDDSDSDRVHAVLAVVDGWRADGLISLMAS